METTRRTSIKVMACQKPFKLPKQTLIVTLKLQTHPIRLAQQDLERQKDPIPCSKVGDIIHHILLADIQVEDLYQSIEIRDTLHGDKQLLFLLLSAYSVRGLHSRVTSRVAQDLSIKMHMKHGWLIGLTG